MKELTAPDQVPTPSTTVLRATVSRPRELLRSPASGVACAHWRLRVHETVAPGMELVHELSSDQPLSLALEAGGPIGPGTVRVAAEGTRFEAQPTFHGEGTPAARAVARHFGLSERVRVEEVVLHPGQLVLAEGHLADLSGGVVSGPYRASQEIPELFGATLRMGERALGLRPAMLAWTLGAAAALLSAAGVAATVSKLWSLQSWGPPGHAEVAAAKVRNPVWP